jgi:exodeoxyribonuclease V alpha subunit
VERSPPGASLASTGKENLAGLVERVTFLNEDSGFCVLRVKARGQRDLITVVGHAAAIGAGEFVRRAAGGSTIRPLAPPGSDD